MTESKETIKRVTEERLSEYIQHDNGTTKSAELWDMDARNALVDALVSFEAFTGMSVMKQIVDDMADAEVLYKDENREHDGTKSWCNIFMSDILTGVTYEVHNTYGTAVNICRVSVKFYGLDAYTVQKGKVPYSVEFENYKGEGYKIETR